LKAWKNEKPRCGEAEEGNGGYYEREELDDEGEDDMLV